MAEEKKKSGLQKDISSIFAGLEDIDNGRQDPLRPRPDTAPAVVPEVNSGLSPGPPASPPLPTSARLVWGGVFPKKRNAFIGLDVGTGSIKLIQLYPVPGGWEVGGWAIEELGPGEKEKNLFEGENFARRLKNLFSAVGAPRSSVICTLRGGEVITTLVQLARLPKNELESACRLEIGRRVAFSVEKALLQLVTVDKDSARPGGKTNYIVAAAGRDTVSRILGTLREAGLQVAALLPLPFGWKDYLHSILECDEALVFALVDIGSSRTLVSIYKGSQLRFSREFETGGDQVTEAIIQAGKTFGAADSLSPEDAEAIKGSVDLFSAEGSRSVKGSLTVSQAGGMVRPVLEKIVQESKRSFDYYRQLFRQEEVGRVFLAGGSARMPGLVKFFQESVRPPVEALNFPERFKIHSSIENSPELKAVFPRLARAAALAVSRRWEVNFIPPLDKVLQNLLRRKIAIIVPVLALFLVSFIFYQSKASLISPQQILLKQKRERLAGITQQLAPYDVLSGLQKQLVAREQIGLSASIRRPNWKGVLKEFSRITPPNVILSGIMTLKEEGPQRILCSGRVIDAQGGITPFIVQVENSPFFREVEKISEDIDRGTFSFSCTLVY